MWTLPPSTGMSSPCAPPRLGWSGGAVRPSSGGSEFGSSYIVPPPARPSEPKFGRIGGSAQPPPSPPGTPAGSPGAGSGSGKRGPKPPPGRPGSSNPGNGDGPPPSVVPPPNPGSGTTNPPS